MRQNGRKPFWHSAGAVLVLVAMGAGLPLAAKGAEPASATETLEASFARLGPALQSSPFGRPIVLRSEEGQASVRGEVHAIVNFPLADLSAAVATPAHWCDVMILHVNTKYCGVSESADGPVLTVHIGKNVPQELPETTRLDFKFTTQARDPVHLKIVLTAPNGPLGTSNYRFVLEAAPMDGARSYLHLTYSYDFNALSRLALNVYLATIGRDKVGFTLANKSNTGAPVYIQGLRGLVERNTMRYFLAINAYLESAHGPDEARLDARLLNWFSATQAYPRQLREVEWKDYVAMKHGEVLRQQAVPPR